MLISTDYLFSILFSMVIKPGACFVAADILQGPEEAAAAAVLHVNVVLVILLVEA